MTLAQTPSLLRDDSTSVTITQLGTPIETHKPQITSDALLYVENLTRTLPNGDILLHKLSFVLNKNEILVVRGKSGAGKTTLLRCISQLISSESDSMKLFLDGKIVSPEKSGIPYWRSEVMYVHQRPPPFEGTAATFYAKIKAMHFQKNKNHLNPVDIASMWDIAPQLWHQNWTSLSGGEQQRVMLAIATACNPSVLLLDEPTSMLDPQSTKLVEDYMITRGNIVWITHNSNQELRVATKILTLLGEGEYEVGSTVSSSPIVVHNLI